MQAQPVQPVQVVPPPSARPPDALLVAEGEKRPRSTWRRDLTASLVIFLIAVPLSLGVALATGAPLQAGLVAAAVGGVVASVLGGAPLQVGGAAMGLVMVAAELVQRYGWRATCAITALAGLAQLALGAARVARATLAISPAMVRGLLAGIGVTVALGQLPVVLGGGPAHSVPASVAGLPSRLAHPLPAALLAGVVTVAVLIAWPRLPGRGGRWARVLPAPLAAVAVATAGSLALDLPRVSLPQWEGQALPTLPDGPVLGVFAAVLTVTLVASMESLLSAVAMERRRAAQEGDGEAAGPTGAAQEPAGQEAANVLSELLGGLTVASSTARGPSGGAAAAGHRRSTVLRGAGVLACAGLLAASLELIPLAVPAALVMVLGVRMATFAHIKHARGQRELPLYVATLGAVLTLGVLRGVAVGVLVAGCLFVRRLSHTRIVVSEEEGRHRVGVHG